MSELPKKGAHVTIAPYGWARLYGTADGGSPGKIIGSGPGEVDDEPYYVYNTAPGKKYPICIKGSRHNNPLGWVAEKYVFVNLA